MKRLVVIPADPLFKYYEKGEIKARYWNPCGFFDEVHIISLSPRDIEPEKVQELVGEARLCIHTVGRPTAFSLPFYYHKVCRLIEQLSPQLIRAHGPWHAGSLGGYSGKKLGIPCLVSIHSDQDAMRRFDRRLLLRLVKPLEYYTMRNASIVICVSNYLHRFARKHGARKTISIYNKVYQTQFSAERFYQRQGKTLTVLSVMRLDPPKCPEYLIRGIRSLDLKLKLIGQGELEENLKRLVFDLGIEERVEFVPMVPNCEIHRHYLEADIFAMATHYEGFCIPVLEAMAAGLPVVACDTDPIPEIVGETGVVVEKSPDAFSRAFSQLAGDVELRERMGRAARERARSLDGTAMEEREARLYEALIAGDAGELECMLSEEHRFVS